MFDLPESRASGEGANFLHSGWVKLSAPKRAGTSSHRILTPQFDLSLDTGVAVLHIAAAGSEVYVERGEAVALEPAATPPARTTVGTWQLIYRIAQRFTLRAQSGEDSALDLIWTWRWD